MTDEYYRTHLRFPPELAEKLKESAESNDRSFNKEVMFRLEQSFEDTFGDNEKALSMMDSMIGKISSKMDKLVFDKINDYLYLEVKKQADEAGVSPTELLEILATREKRPKP